MKATGIIRKIDNLGRLVIPRELIKSYGYRLKETELEIFTEEDKIIVREYIPGCIFCDSTNNVKKYKGKYICNNCLKELKNLKQDKIGE